MSDENVVDAIKALAAKVDRLMESQARLIQAMEGIAGDGGIENAEETMARRPPQDQGNVPLFR